MPRDDWQICLGISVTFETQGYNKAILSMSHIKKDKIKTEGGPKR